MSYTALPRFSIVIPTYARPRQLAGCLKSLAKLEYPRERFQVIVVDDGSPMSLNPVVEPYRTSMNVTLHTQNNKGPATARNTGASVAAGDVLAFTDDDCAPAPDWLDRLAEAVKANPDALIGGQVINGLTRNLCSTASQLLVSYLYEYYNADPRSAKFFTSNNFALRTKLFQEVGGFDTTYPLAAAEDREFCDRWFTQRRRLVYEPRAIIHHYHGLTLKKFWRQHLHYGRGAYTFRIARAKRDAGPVKVEPMSFYFRLLAYPITSTDDIAQQRNAPWLSSLMFLSQVANTMGFFLEKRTIGAPQN
jgi:GT2 family glycosyltransferase